MSKIAEDAMTSPSLLEACKELLDSLGTYDTKNNVDIRDAIQRLDEAKLAARIAIAEAEGKTDPGAKTLKLSGDEP